MAKSGAPYLHGKIATTAILPKQEQTDKSKELRHNQSRIEICVPVGSSNMPMASERQCLLLVGRYRALLVTELDDDSRRAIRKMLAEQEAELARWAAGRHAGGFPDRA
jgi:hypothetical protein